MAAKWIGKKWKQFLEALGERYQRVLQIIDEALNSDDFKEKKWAVDLILKGQEEVEAERKKSAKPKMPAQAAEPVYIHRPELLEVSLLSDEALIRRIRDSLKAWQGEVPEVSIEPAEGGDDGPS